MKRLKVLVLRGLLICILVTPAVTTVQAGVSDGVPMAIKSSVGMNAGGEFNYRKRGPFLPSSSVEPTTVTLLGLGITGLLWLGAKRKSE